MTQFDKFPPAIQQIVSTLETRMAAVRPRMKMADELAKSIAAELADIQKEWQMAGGQGGFFDWAERHSGIPVSTIHRYLNVDRAIKAGLDQKLVKGKDGKERMVKGEVGIMELAQKGAALLQGMSPEVLKGDLSQEDISRLIESRKHEGLIAVRVPEGAISDVDFVVEKITVAWAKDNDGEKIEKPEALGQAFRILKQGLTRLPEDE